MYRVLPKSKQPSSLITSADIDRFSKFFSLAVNCAKSKIDEYLTNLRRKLAVYFSGPPCMYLLYVYSHDDVRLLTQFPKPRHNSADNIRGIPVHSDIQKL